MVYEGVREIRRAVLLNRGTIDYDSDVEWDNPDIDYTKAEYNPLGAIGVIGGSSELGMISHEKSLITIFGHKHKIKNFIKNFDNFH